MTLATGSGASNVLETLIIELIGDDKNLQAIFDKAVKDAKAAAVKISASFAEGYEGVDRAVLRSVRAFKRQDESLDATTKIIEGMMAQAETGFNQIVRSGEMGAKAFEDYRKEALAGLDAIEATARQAGVTSESFDRLRRRVAEAEYTQRRQVKTSEDQQREGKELDNTIRDLSARIATQRNLWASRITSDEEFTQSTRELKAELASLADTTELSAVQMRKVTQSMAYAQRGLDSAAGVASRGGLAWTAQIAISNQLGQSLRNLGPAGGAAASALGAVGLAAGSLFTPISMADVSFKSLAVTVGRFAAVIAPMAAAVAAVAGAAGLGALTVAAARSARELENATLRTGLSVEGLQELQHAARSTGVPLELLSTTMQRLQRRAADANAGNQGLKAAFDQLGVSLTDAHGRMRSTEELLGQVADGINAVENNADRLAIAFKVFDTEGGRLLPLLTQGSAGIRELRQEARDLGLVISGDTVLSLSQFQAEVETVKRQFEVLRVEVGAAFLPVMRDLLLPLVRDQLVPWLQTLTARIGEFTDRLFEAGEAGDEMRRKVSLILAPFLGVADAAITIGAAIYGGFRTIIDSLPILTAQLELWVLKLMRNVEGASEKIAQFFMGFSVVPIEPTFTGSDFSKIDELEDRLVELTDNFILGVNSWAPTVRGGLDRALDPSAWAISIQEWLAGAAAAVNEGGREFGEALTNSIADGATPEGLTAALEGSLAYAEEQVRLHAEAFRMATDDEGRATAKAAQASWQAVVDAMLAPFRDSDPLAEGRAWTARLAAELRQGVKEPLEVIGLLEASVIRLQTQAEEDFTMFGWDSAEYQATIARLEFIEAYLERLKSEYGVIEIAVPDVTASVTSRPLPDLTLPAATTTPEAALVSVYQRVLQVADAQAKLTGTTEATRDAYQEAVDVFEITLGMLDEQSDGWLLVANALIQARSGLASVNEELATPPGTALLDYLTAVTNTASAARDAILGVVAAVVDSDPARAFASTLRTSQGVEADRRAAAYLGEDFDQTASEIKALEAEIKSLLDRYDTLGAFERRRLTLASERLIALKAEVAANDAAEESLADFTKAVEEWQAAVDALGVETDPLTRRAEQLQAWLDAGQITAEEYAEMLADLAAAQDRLLASASGSGFDAWAEGVNRLGVTIDPVSDAAARLGTLMEDGRITAEEYADGIDLLNAAMRRLEQSEADAQVEAITAAWESASGEINAALGVTESRWNELRDAAVDAFQAGIIGADELNQALRTIGILEVAAGFREVAAGLDDAARIIPDFIGGITEAFAAFQAGERTTALAMGFDAATAAVKGLQAAFSDTANVGSAVLDTLIGGAAAVATALGGPALGRAIGAIGEFVKGVLGDLANGLEEIRRAVEETASSSQYLGRDLIEGIAASNTQRVSRGGLLGLLGLTKAELDQEAFQAGVSMAEGIANGLVGTLRAGDFEQAWKSMVDDIIVQGIIERFMATAAVQQAITDAFALLEAGDSAGAAGQLDQMREEFRFIWEQIQEIIGAMDELAINVSGALTNGITSALDSSTVDEAWERTTLAMKNTLRDAIVAAFMEGEAMKRILASFNAALDEALGDGVITEEEMRHLEALFGQTEGPLRELWDALDALGLGFADLNEQVNQVTSSLSNVPSVFKDVSATFDSQGWTAAASLANVTPPEQEVREVTVEFHGDVYGWDDFEQRVTEAWEHRRNRDRLQAHGISRGF